MHLLLIIGLLAIAFPMFRRTVASMLAILFWIGVAGAVLAMVGAIGR